jgi:hypothetical protein
MGRFRRFRAFGANLVAMIIRPWLESKNAAPDSAHGVDWRMRDDPPRLTLRRLNGGRSVTDADSITCYGVEGLPLNQKATIFRMKSRWSVLRAKDDVSEDWEGEYLTPQEALAVLERELVMQSGSGGLKRSSTVTRQSARR